MSNRVGQNAGGAAIFVIILAALFILYILFLPPDERAELLGDNSTSSNSKNNETTYSGFDRILLDEKIGKLDYLSLDFREYDIPSFRIYAEQEGSILRSVKSVYVQNSLSNKKTYNLTFTLDKKLTSEVFLSFNVQDSKGRLEIYLNGAELFNGVVSGSPEPIELPSDLLKNENTLFFRVSGPGLSFWRNNHYDLSDLVVGGSVLDLSHSMSRQFFYLSQSEVENLEEIKLKFYPNCKQSEVGPVKIYLNGDEAFSGVGDCGVYNTMFLDKQMVLGEKNELEFIVTKGSYLFDRVSVSVRLEDKTYPVYYFDLDEDLFVGDDLNSSFNVTLHLRFANDDDKRLEYLINGRRKSVTSNDLSYSAILDDYVMEGSNAITLVPKSVVEIAQMRVTLDEEE